MRLVIPALAAACVIACAHAPPPRLPAPRWPSAPEKAAVQWADSFPDERSLAAQKSVLRKVLEFIAGIEDDDEPARRSILVRPFGLAVHLDTLYVADPDGRRVLAVAWRDGSFRPVECSLGWEAPMAVTVGDDGSLYVADAGAARVVRVHRGSCTALGGTFVRPTGLALVGDRLYIVDPPQHAVFLLATGGGPVSRFGKRGEGQGELNFPTAIASTPEGNLLVVDALNWRVVTYTPEGAVVSAFGEPGTEGGAFGRPKAVAVDRMGRIYVSDAQFGVILAFDAAGKFLFAFGGSAREPFSLSLPAGLAIVGDRLFVADAYHHRVEQFQLLEDKP